MVNYYTADLHINDNRLIKNGLRNFNSIKLMNSSIHYSFSFIDPQDSLYILGDLSSGTREGLRETTKILKDIPTENIFIICGNHDSIIYLNQLKEDGIIKNWYRWKVVTDNINGTNYNIALFHHPTIDYHNSLSPVMCFHGHSHGMLIYKFPDLFDVGWDVWHKPVTAKEIIEKEYDLTV